MWYAVTSKPLAMVLSGALLANMTVAGTGFFATAPVLHVATDPTVTLKLPQPVAVQSQPKQPKCAPQGFPAAFYQPVSLPSRFRYSERGALTYLAHALHIHVQFTGPDYAMIGEHIPYNHPAPATKLLLRILNIPYIQGTFVLMGDRMLIVHNTPMDDKGAAHP
ncbi:hypothetical protein AB4090_02420 [Acidithiobacillus sp. IBUN Pt1247-S3]|uniref:hypothetical protein n=1 Tax=Acidithiobacillus sp. IBUN Pt1247-S3 TaxID=3166642 RepID=UPI0034E3F619